MTRPADLAAASELEALLRTVADEIADVANAEHQPYSDFLGNTLLRVHRCIRLAAPNRDPLSEKSGVDGTD